MGLNWLGQRANPGDRSPFKVFLGFYIFLFVLGDIFAILRRMYTIDSDTWMGITLFQLTLIRIYVVLKTRRHIRERSGIPETSCQCCEVCGSGGCEDCCCAKYCHLCVITQMARHTAEYETYKAQCCSETGLPVSAPQLQFGETEIEMV